jgi:hypothetical protein
VPEAWQARRRCCSCHLSCDCVFVCDRNQLDGGWRLDRELEQRVSVWRLQHLYDYLPIERTCSKQAVRSSCFTPACRVCTYTSVVTFVSGEPEGVSRVANALKQWQDGGGLGGKAGEGGLAP